MADDRTTYASEREIAELWSEIRRLREERETPQENGSPGNGNGDGHQQPAEEQKPNPPAAEEQKPDGKPHPYRKFVIIGVVLVVAVGALLWWLHSRKYQSTDDAQVQAHISAIAARTAGVVTAVYVEENQRVNAGQLLAELDPRDYQNAVNQARSQLTQAQAQTQAEQPNLPVTQVTNRTNVSTAASDVASATAGIAVAERDYQAAQAKVAEAQANNAKAQADVERYRPLVEKDEVPRQQFDQVVANAKALAATVASNQAAAAAMQSQVEQRRAELEQAQQRLAQARQNGPQQVAIQQANVAGRRAGALAARTQLEQALLNLSYTRIVSPVDGIVAKRSAEVGQHVAPGQEVVLVSQTQDLWVTANFRETQLRQIHPGQSVRIHIDAVDQDFNGRVEGMPAATGAITSVLPPENATGNFVKVVQRLPVRIQFDPNQSGLERLRPGMSAEPSVKVQ